uniref:Reverse transcriptase n=1 Tax=Panagrolaimus superbus TaxID=310955 RepID=A0A914Z6T1_9BILA
MTVARSYEFEVKEQVGSKKAEAGVNAVGPIEVDPAYRIDLSKSEITDEEKQQLKALLEEFEDVWARSAYDLGSCQFECPTLKTTTEVPPKVRVHRVPHKWKNELNTHLKGLLDTGRM